MRGVADCWSEKAASGRAARRGLLGLLALLAVGLTTVAADDVRAHRAQPRDSPAARAYMAAMMRNDPAKMWETYSPRARQALGGDRAAYIAYMEGAGVHDGPINRFQLVASVPAADGLTLLYYRVDLASPSDAHPLLVPVIINAAGQVEDAGDDGLYFVPPRVPSAAS